MKNTLHVLHLEDDRCDGELIRQILKAEGLVRDVVRVETGADFAAALGQEPFDFILSDYTLPGFNGMAALGLAREKQPDTPFIFVSGTIKEDLAVESLKRGATDYVFKNRLSRLGPAVRRALQGAEERDENRRAEEAMRQSEHKYRQVFESLTNAAFLTDLETGRVLDVNKQGELLLGRTRAEIIGLNQSRFHSLQTFETYRQAQTAADAQNASMAVEAGVVRKDGAVIPVNIRATILLLYGRKLVLGLYRDITARKQAEEQLQEQATLLDLVPEAVLVRDLEDRIQYWNQGAVRLYGWTIAEALGRLSTELLYHDLTEFNTAKRLVLECGSWSGELHQLTRENHEIVVHSRWTLARDQQGESKSIMLVNTDVTEKSTNRLEQPVKLVFGD